MAPPSHERQEYARSRTNRILSLLPDDEYERLRPHLVDVVFDYRKKPLRGLASDRPWYFPIDGVASLVITIALGKRGVGTTAAKD